jgi:hypothetical protein
MKSGLNWAHLNPFERTLRLYEIKRNPLSLEGNTMRWKTRLPSIDPELEKEKTFAHEMKNVLNIGRVKKVFRVGTEIFGACKPFIEKPTLWNAMWATLSVGKVFVDDVEIWADAYFDGDEWINPYSRDFNQTIVDVLSKFKYETLRTSEENTMIRLIDIGGVNVGWTFNTKLNAIDHIYIETEKLDKGRAIIKKLLWEKFKDNPVVMRYNKRTLSGSDESKVIFEVDDAFQPLPSEKATEYSSYLKNCLDHEVPRSVMLYGPPGTGKSTMARTIVNRLDLRSFRIRVEDISGLESSTLFEAISIFEPDAVILDDFDRTSAQAQLLETLEFFQRHVKLVVATVNNMELLDQAILRPGRFDELILIDRMDDNVIKHVLGTYVDGFDTVKDWPIAFIQEYVKRRRFMSPEGAILATAELAERVDHLTNLHDEDENIRMRRASRGRTPSGSKPVNSDAIDAAIVGVSSMKGFLEDDPYDGGD